MANSIPSSGHKDIPTAKVQHVTDVNEMIRKDIQEKWKHLAHDDIAALKSDDDLVKLVMNKYKLDKPQTEREVENVLHGRHIH